MDKLKLNAEQVSRLLRDKYLVLDDCRTIEIYRESLIVNCNGEISNIDTLDMQFIEEEIEHREIIDNIQNLICEHLNLSPSEVIYSSGYGEEFVFKIRFAPCIEWGIVVCVKPRTFENMQAVCDYPIDNKIDSENIGLYKRLGKSAYFFRWFEDI